MKRFVFIVILVFCTLSLLTQPKKQVDEFPEQNKNDIEKKTETKVANNSEKNFEGFTFLRVATYTCNTITKTVEEYLHEKTGLEFVLIPGGTFLMGSENGYPNEKPVHQVTLSPYLISKTEVTQEAWYKIMGNNPSYFKKGNNYPVERISWDMAMEFCQKSGLQLPTEAQWEFAARAGSDGDYCYGNGIEQLEEYAWYNINSSETHPVAQKNPNAFGLYDMSGNIWEWCADWYQESYSNDSVTDPTGPAQGQHRVDRGGGWFRDASALRSAYRGKRDPSGADKIIGFRVVAKKQ